MIRKILISLLAITASAASAQFGATSPTEAGFWIGGVSMLPTSGDTTQWKNRWTGYVGNVSAQTGINLSRIQQAINDLAAARGTPQFAFVKTRIATDLAGLTVNVKNSTNQLKIALYSQLLKFQ